MDLLIKGGTVVTATESFVADVAVEAGQIAEVAVSRGRGTRSLRGSEI